MNASGARANKPELVLIHGWGLGPAAWDVARPALEARFNVISLALPGYGDAAPESVSFAETATRLAASIPDGAYVCGWSLGAMLATQIAAQARRTLAGLILVGATPSFIKRTDWHPAQEPPHPLSGSITGFKLKPLYSFSSEESIMKPPNCSIRLFSYMNVMSLIFSISSASVAVETDILNIGPLHAKPAKFSLILKSVILFSSKKALNSL